MKTKRKYFDIEEAREQAKERAKQRVERLKTAMEYSLARIKYNALTVQDLDYLIEKAKQLKSSFNAFNERGMI